MSAPREAVIVKDPEFDQFRRVERRRWRADLYGVPGFRRKYLPSRRALVEWCQEFGFAVVESPSVESLAWADERDGLPTPPG